MLVLAVLVLQMMGFDCSHNARPSIEVLGWRVQQQQQQQQQLDL
jgi:hypothetical protein